MESRPAHDPDETLAASDRDAPRSWNRTAVLSAMFCIPFFCPPMTLIAAITGALALRSLRHNPDTKGAWLARSAIAFGVAATVLSAWLLWSSGLGTIVRGPSAALAPLFAADAEGVHREWIGPASRISAEELNAFAREASARYGAFASAQWSESRTTPLEQPATRSVAVVPVTIRFASGPVEADLGLERFDEKSGKGTMMWRSVRILDAQRGDLLFPPGEPPPPALPPEAPSKAAPTAGRGAKGVEPKPPQ
jgi:hypothetical protein